MSVFQASLVVDNVADELSERGLQVPFLVSSPAIDLNPRKGTKMVRCLAVRGMFAFIPPILFDRALAGLQKEAS